MYQSIRFVILVIFLSSHWVQAGEVEPPPLAKRTYFYVGGKYVGEPGKEVMQGQMYVETLTPAKIRHAYPLVLIHGLSQTATNWMTTPDGRMGWAEYFANKGYVVYMIDQPARGRSAWHPNIDGSLRVFSARQVEQRFTATESFRLWPQAAKHTQWPGSGENKGRMGDPIFDAFYRTQVESLVDAAETQSRMREAGAALLDRIGPAILLTHSQGGLLGWVVADARPAAVKGIVALEPSGPPFENAVTGTDKTRAWGVTDIPVAYEPPLGTPSELVLEKEDRADGPNLHTCTLQREPARKLRNLSGIPTLLVVAQASYHSVYDHCTAKFLKQAGVPVDFVRLENERITGNGHMLMIEKNSLDIADFVDRWIDRQFGPR